VTHICTHSGVACSERSRLQW